MPEFLDTFINVLLKIVVRMSNNKLYINYPKIPKAIFLEEKNVTYMYSIITYILVDYSLTAQRNVCLINSIWMAERESESAVSDVLEFNCKCGIF